VFSERQAGVVADHLVARILGATAPAGYDGTGTCYIEFGGHEVGRVDVDFFSTPGHPTGTFVAPSSELTAEKADFGASRAARWFGA
jgi:sulfide:quinone oxidoreductase